MSTQKQLIFLGAPGSGKGTQANTLVKNYSYKHVSTGDLLRSEIAKGSTLGAKVKGIMDSGNLVDDNTVLELLKANCNVSAGKYIFDGFPRTLNQAVLLDRELLSSSSSVAIYFKIDLTALMQRAINRRVAPKSGMIYNLLSKPPKVAGVCDVSGEPLVHRKDDQEDVVKIRIDVFKNTIGELEKYYSEKGILRVVDASKDESTLKNEILKIIA